MSMYNATAVLLHQQLNMSVYSATAVYCCNQSRDHTAAICTRKTIMLVQIRRIGRAGKVGNLWVKVVWVNNTRWGAHEGQTRFRQDITLFVGSRMRMHACNEEAVAMGSQQVPSHRSVAQGHVSGHRAASLQTSTDFFFWQCFLASRAKIRDDMVLPALLWDYDASVHANQSGICEGCAPKHVRRHIVSLLCESCTLYGWCCPEAVGGHRAGSTACSRETNPPLLLTSISLNAERARYPWSLARW